MIGVLVQRGNLDTETEIHMRKTIGADRLRKEAVVYKLGERPGAAPSLRHFDLIHFLLFKRSHYSPCGRSS